MSFASMGDPGLVPPISPGIGPAPSTVNVQAGMTPRVVSPTSMNSAACGATPVGATAATAAASSTGMTQPGGACVVGDASTPGADNPTGKYVALAIGGLIGLVTIAAIVQKYKTMGSYSSFWGRMIGLADGAAAFGMGYSDFSNHSANDCTNFMGEAELSSPCPCLACCYILFAYGAFQLGFNLPFLYANEKTISKMYAKFGLFNQAALMFTISGGAAGAIKFANGSMIGLAVAAVGCLVGVMFVLGWFKGEDGILGRMFQSAKDMINGASEAAAAMVDDGLKVFGLNADERSKVTLSNVYNFCRVGRGPDWSAGDEDGGPDGPGGEIIGYIGENGVAEGVAVTAGRPGWAKVKWDGKTPGQVGKTAEYRIGANNKYELKMAEETEGIVDKLMGQTFALFGYDASKSKQPAKEKKQLEFILTSRLPGETENDQQADLKDDDGDDSPKKQPSSAAAVEDILIMTCEVFDASGNSQGKCDDTKQQLFKSAIRHRQLGNKQDAIVVELQKLPPEAALLALVIKVPEGKKLGHWGTMNVRATSTGHDLSKLTVTPAEGNSGIQKHQGSGGYFALFLYSPDGGAKWYAEKDPNSLGSAQGINDSLNGKVLKFLEAREPSKKKKKANTEEKDVSKLLSVDEIFDYLKIEIKCEAQAREMMSAKLDAVTSGYVTKLKAQGVPDAQATLQGKKLALIQINKQHQVLYQKTLLIKRNVYLKQGMHPVHAMIMAKKDANRAALYDGKEAEIRKAVMNTIKEEKEAEEEAKKAESDQLVGQAASLVSGLWTSWSGTTEEADDESAKKKKKKKKKGGEEAAPPPPAPAAPVAAPLPPQLANMNPQQIAALRALQQRQLAAKSNNAS